MEAFLWVVVYALVLACIVLNKARREHKADAEYWRYLAAERAVHRNRLSAELAQERSEAARNASPH